MSSVRYLHLPLSIGDEVEKTVDIRTDCGYVLLINEDPALLESDYRVITALQKTMFEVHESFPNNELEVDEQQELEQFNDQVELLGPEVPQYSVEFTENVPTIPDDLHSRASGSFPQLAPPYPQPLYPDSPILRSVESPSFDRPPSLWKKISSAFYDRARGVLKFWRKIGYSFIGLYILCHILAQTSPIVYLKFFKTV